MICLAVLFSACGRQIDTATESAQFALDSGDWETAITKATDALTAQPADFDATMLLSAAYGGRAGVKLLKLAKKLTESGIESSAFDAIHDILVADISSDGLADIRRAVSTLANFAGTVSRTKEYCFQLGIYEAIEAFGLPSITAQPTAGGAITVANITQEQTSNIVKDLADADNKLICADIPADNQLVTTIRKSFCVLKARTVGAPDGTGFTRTVLQDRVRCELDDNRANLVAANFLSGNVTTCNDFNFSACTAVDTVP
ncbi:MAG: hypothetical protein HY543_01465 [Deltaproteobacteria bacterium]|nr:hypothetical protein [Deltaproteobacteria bacterium]